MSSAIGATTEPVTVVGVAAHAEPLVATLLAARDVEKLGAPKSAYAHQTRREIACGRAKPVHMLLAVSLADADDTRIPIESVTEFYRQAIALIEDRRRARESAPIDAPDIMPLIEAEDRKEFGENVKERLVIAAPNDPAAIEQLLAASAVERAAQDRRDGFLRRHLVRLRGLARSFSTTG